MLRETTFWIGGIVMIALGILLGIGLFLAGAGVDFFDAWLGSGISVGFGAFFLYVARDEHRDRLAYLEKTEAELSGAPPTPPP